MTYQDMLKVHEENKRRLLDEGLKNNGPLSHGCRCCRGLPRSVQGLPLAQTSPPQPPSPSTFSLPMR
ncbi:MAG: hypothetical protein WCI05_07055, partial [Myxococcales bacterium]